MFRPRTAPLAKVARRVHRLHKTAAFACEQIPLRPAKTAFAPHGGHVCAETERKTLTITNDRRSGTLTITNDRRSGKHLQLQMTDGAEHLQLQMTDGAEHLQLQMTVTVMPKTRRLRFLIPAHVHLYARTCFTGLQRLERRRVCMKNGRQAIACLPCSNYWRKVRDSNPRYP